LRVDWTASAVADFISLSPDDLEIEQTDQALYARLDDPTLRYRDVPVPFKDLQSSFTFRLRRFAFIYQLHGEYLIVVAVQESLDVPLSIMICDEDEEAGAFLENAIRQQQNENEVVLRAPTLAQARQQLQNINTVFIDPLTTGLEEATAVIVEIRESFPEMNVVLYLDTSIAERNRKEFFRGERSVFFQYRTLDKQAPEAVLQEELRSALKACRRQLTWKRSEASVKRALQKAEESSGPAVPTGLLATAHAGVAELSRQARMARGRLQPKSVFVSYRFADQTLVDGFVQLLRRNGFTVETGHSVNTYVHEGVLERIKKCEFFLSLMTRDEEKKDGSFTASAWVLEEKGAALALGKRPVLMVQKGISQHGGLHGDWQVINFTLENFLQAALQAVDQLKAYSGDPSEPEL